MKKRVDANQSEITKIFRDMGCSVAVTSDLGHGFPDLVVGLSLRNILVEIKDGSKPPSQRKLTADEQKFHDSWKGSIFVVKNVTEAIDLINRARRGIE